MTQTAPTLTLAEALQTAVDHIATLHGVLEDLASLGATVAICGSTYDDAKAREALTAHHAWVQLGEHDAFETWWLSEGQCLWMKKEAALRAWQARALRSHPPAPAEGAPAEAVAWRRWDSEHGWWVYYEGQQEDAEPLYTHPAPSQGARVGLTEGDADE